MAESPDNHTLRLLREIRDSGEEMKSLLLSHGDRLDHIDQRLDEIHETMYATAGYAMHANVRHDTVNERLNKLEKRLVDLENNA